MVVVLREPLALQRHARLQRLRDPAANVLEVDHGDLAGRHVEVAEDQRERALAHRSAPQQEEASGKRHTNRRLWHGPTSRKSGTSAFWRDDRRIASPALHGDQASGGTVVGVVAGSRRTRDVTDDAARGRTARGLAAMRRGLRRGALWPSSTTVTGGWNPL